MKRYTADGRYVDSESGYSKEVYVTGCDLFLMEQWNFDSTESDDAQMMQIFARFISMSLEERTAWDDKLVDRGIKTAEDLTQAERDFLFRIRPVDEMVPEGDVLILRTYYGPGSDEAYAELIGTDDVLSGCVLNNKDLYNFGNEWQRIFTRIPELLRPRSDRCKELVLLKEEGCRLARGLPLDDYKNWRYALPEPGFNMPLDEAFSMYQRISNVGFVIVLDELALGPNWRDIDALTEEQQAAETDPDPGYDNGEMDGGTGQRWWPPVRRCGEYWEQRKNERKMLTGWYDSSGDFTRWNWLTRDEFEMRQYLLHCSLCEEDAIWITGALDMKKLEAYVEEHKATEQALAAQGKDSKSHGA